jgi:hypothetical protein
MEKSNNGSQIAAGGRQKKHKKLIVERKSKNWIDQRSTGNINER